ncbi:S-adenosyl-L-methionine-dependent methyltransferase, partial [Jimgerdemannia flammicorona]
MFTLHQIRINEPFNRDEMKLKELESQLQDCAAFENPKIKLEQYPTTAHLAARMLFTADSVYNDIQDKSIGDFGCGCGILSIAANILGAGYCVGFDIDPEAIEIARQNCEDFEIDMDFVLTDLGAEESNFDMFPERLDTIVMNPPFGTKNKGIDMVFLKKAINVSHSV